MLENLISKSQFAFVKGRQILDSFFVANKVIHSALSSKKGCFIFKIDFEKAFDSIKWSYLIWALEKMGFGKKWIS